MNNDIIHKLEDIAIKMNNQHDRLLALTISVTRLSLTINSVGISVPLETRAIILAKISDLHIVV